MLGKGNATPTIYLSDMHDENVIRSDKGNVFVVDCDIIRFAPVGIWVQNYKNDVAFGILK